MPDSLSLQSWPFTAQLLDPPVRMLTPHIIFKLVLNEKKDFFQTITHGPTFILPAGMEMVLRISDVPDSEENMGPRSEASCTFTGLRSGGQHRQLNK